MGALTDALKNFGPFVSPLIFTLFPVCLTLLIISVVVISCLELMAIISYVF